MKEIGQRILSQDNRMTADPIFLVQERIELSCDEGCADAFVWYRKDGDGERVDDETFEKLEELDSAFFYEDGEQEFLNEHCKIGIQYRWEYVMCAFTEEGANEYITLNGHRHKGKLRTYVDSLFRCPEMIAIRNYLIEQAKQ
jgi:hypothetical protein